MRSLPTRTRIHSRSHRRDGRRRRYIGYSVKSGFGPAKGSVAFVDGGFVYKTKPNANGADSFTILIDDGEGGTAEQVVTVTINPSTTRRQSRTATPVPSTRMAPALIVPIGAADVDGDALAIASRPERTDKGLGQILR